jgi:uncharacterized membrane protein
MFLLSILFSGTAIFLSTLFFGLKMLIIIVLLSIGIAIDIDICKKDKHKEK